VSQQQRMEAIESGDLVVLDPREARERELKAASVQRKKAKAKSYPPSSVGPPSAPVASAPAAAWERAAPQQALLPQLPQLPGASAPRVRRVVSAGDAKGRDRHLEEQLIRAENEKLRAENEKLRQANLAAGGELVAGDEQHVLATYRQALREVLAMRSRCEFEQATVDAYHGAAVQLSDADFVRAYQCLTKVYCDEADEGHLVYLGIGEAVDDEGSGFIESACTKMGEQLSMPRCMRVQKHSQELALRDELEAERKAKEERERELLRAQAALKTAAQSIFDSLLPVWLAARQACYDDTGDVTADEAEAKRFRWRKELQLLVRPAAELKKLSRYEWQNMSLGGLRGCERYGLLHKLTQRDVPGQAEAFLMSLRHAIGSVPPTEAELAEMGTLPGWFTHDASITVGTRVITELGDVGTVRFKGRASFREGIWVGVELARAVGKNDGSVQRVRYFRCLPSHGIFTRATRLELAPPEPAQWLDLEWSVGADGRVTLDDLHS